LGKKGGGGRKAKKGEILEGNMENFIGYFSCQREVREKPGKRKRRIQRKMSKRHRRAPKR